MRAVAFKRMREGAALRILIFPRQIPKERTDSDQDVLVPAAPIHALVETPSKFQTTSPAFNVRWPSYDLKKRWSRHCGHNRRVGCPPTAEG